MNILQQIAALLGVKLTKVHEKTVANKEAIEAEVARAKASETLLDTNIKNETKRAQDEETRIELKAVDLVNAEEARALAAEKVLTDNLNTETDRATKAETALRTKIDTDIKAEADRAKEAEEAIIDDLNTEIARAEDAEGTLTSNLNTEISRAKAAEKANTDAITAIDEAYQEADTALQTAINNEAAARTAADNSLSARITTEVSERKAADTALDEKKVDKVEGKQLSTEDYTTAEKTKVGNLSSYVVDNIFAKDTGSANLTLNYNTKDPVTGTITKHITLVPTVSSTVCGVVSPSQKLVLDNLISGDSALSTLGTPSPTWQLNLGSGPKIKNSGGIFELRNAADNAYADLTVNALTIKGNVTQEGGSFITQAETVSAKDNTILLNSGETGAGVTKGTAGVEIDRGTLPKYKFVFDESDDRFKVGSEEDLWSVMLRDNETDLTNGGILTWDATTKRAKTAFNIDDLSTKYLPLAGGTMTGALKFTPMGSIAFLNENNAIRALFGYGNLPTGKLGLILKATLKDNIIAFNTPGDLFHWKGSDEYKIWTEGNDGADSGLDADLLDGQHGSYYAKATDLGNYIPLAGNSTSTPITGHLYTKDVFSWGLYGMKIEGADGLPRTTHIQFNANQTGAMGSEPAKSNAYTEMGSIGEVWGPNTVSQLRVGYEDNLPVLKYRNNPEGPEIKEYNIYHEGNLDVNSMVSGFLPLSAGMDKPLTGVLYVSGLGGAGKRGINITSGTVTSTDSGIEFISKDGVMGIGMTQDEGATIWVGTSQDDTHTCATIDNSDRWTFPNNVYFRGSEGATLEDLSGYLPLSGGTMTGSIILPKNVSNNPSLKGLIGEPGWLTRPAGVRGNSILTYHEDNIMLGNDKAILQSISHTSVIVAENELILSAPLIAINTASISCGGEAEIWTSGNDGAGSGLDADLLDGRQGSEYALASSLSSYLPLSAGSSKSLTGVLYANGGILDGAENWNVNAKFGSTSSLHNGIEILAQNGTFGMGMHSDGNARMWIGDISTASKSYFLIINKSTKGANFLYRPMYNGTNLATVSEIPTIPSSLPNPQSITFTGAVTGSYDGSAAKTVNIPSVPSLSGGAGATSGQYVSGVTVSGHTVTVSKASLPTSLPANGGTSDFSNNLRVKDLRAAAILPNYGGQAADKSLFAWFNNLGTPNGEWWSGIHIRGWEPTYASWQLCSKAGTETPASDSLWFRTGVNTSWNGWKRVAFANEIPTTLPASDVYSWAKAASKPSYGWAEITGKPASMPASDVYAWAKASTKPSYAWSEITGKPTIPSLSGYATQSWVQSQGYLTSHQSLAGYVAGTKVDRTTLGPLPSYSSTGIPTTSLLAYWNGAYTGTSSNLAYCAKGAFGDMCTQTASNYVNVAGTQTISGAKTFTAFVVCSAGAGTSSDIRLKKYINRMFDAEEVLSNLSGYRYVMKETDTHYAGLIAQEVQEVLPEAVREDENGFLTVDTYPIVAALVEANKAKDNRIKALEDRLSALEKKMSMILK